MVETFGAQQGSPRDFAVRFSKAHFTEPGLLLSMHVVLRRYTFMQSYTFSAGSGPAPPLEAAGCYLHLSKATAAAAAAAAKVTLHTENDYSQCFSVSAKRPGRCLEEAA